MQYGERVMSTKKEKALHKRKAHGGCHREADICLRTLSDQQSKGEPEPVVPASTWLKYCT